MLTAERVTKRFEGPRGQITVLDRAEFALAPGSRLGLVGPSGCGQSTLALVLALLLAPDTGRVVLDGTPVAGYGLAVPQTCAAGSSSSGSRPGGPSTHA